MNTEDNLNTLFVQLVEKYPCLYNSHLADYSRKEVTDKAWAEISRSINIPVLECKMKWKNLRTVYVRNAKRSLDKKRWSKPYYLEEYMHFILPYIKPNCSFSTGNVQPLEDNLLEDDAVGNNQESCPQGEGLPSSSAIKRIKRKKTNLGDSKYYRREERETRSRRDQARSHFLLSLLPDIQAMPDIEFRHFRKKILEIIDELSPSSDPLFCFPPHPSESQSPHSSDDSLPFTLKNEPE